MLEGSPKLYKYEILRHNVFNTVLFAELYALATLHIRTSGWIWDKTKRMILKNYNNVHKLCKTTLIHTL